MEWDAFAHALISTIESAPAKGFPCKHLIDISTRRICLPFLSVLAGPEYVLDETVDFHVQRGEQFTIKGDRGPL